MKNIKLDISCPMTSNDARDLMKALQKKEKTSVVGDDTSVMVWELGEGNYITFRLDQERAEKAGLMKP